MQTKILEDRPILLGGGAKKKWGGGNCPPCPTLATGVVKYIKSLPQLASKFYSVTKNWVGNSLFCLNDATLMLEPL